MKKILNPDVSNVVDEMLSGYVSAYKKYYKRIGEYTAIKYRGARKDKVALVIGGEGQGVSQIVRSKADYIVSIPMKGRGNSLNASNAAAILLYEVDRQRTLAAKE